MGRIGIPEILVIVAIVALIFGASRLPDLGRRMGRHENFKEPSKEGPPDKRER